MWISPLDVVLCSILSHALSQVHRQDDHGDEVDGMKIDTVELLDDDDGRERRALELSQDTCGRGDVGEIVKSLNDAGVLTMSTLVSCVPCVSNHFFFLPARAAHEHLNGTIFDETEMEQEEPPEEWSKKKKEATRRCEHHSP